MIDLVILILQGIVIYFWIRHRTKIAHEKILFWMNENNYDLISAEYCFFNKGPWIFINGPMMVYKINAKNLDGEDHNGYLKIGDWFLGLLGSKEVVLRWN